MDIDLSSQVAIVTGAGQGIGAAIAHELAANGATVVVADLESSPGAEVAAACGGSFVATDVADEEQVRRCVESTGRQFGRIDTLVNNAGITRFVDGFFDIDAEHWDAIHAVDARGVFLCMRAAAPHLRNGGGGSIVNISSIAAKGYRHTSSAAYAAAKGAVISLTRSAAMQLGRHGIRVNAICPGITLTSLNATWLEQNPSYLAEVPLGIPTRPEHIAAMVAFLASPAGALITGQSINIDGGLTID